MSLLICPECGAENPVEAENCSVCQASLVGVEPADFEEPLESEQDKNDLLPQSEEDLTGLLESLKQGEDLGDFPATEGEEIASLPMDSGEIQGQVDDEDEPDVPEWLNRIRQRAQAEEDSVGEITQKISAAQESLVEEQAGSQRQGFESLLEKIHGEGDDTSQVSGKEEAQDESSGPQEQGTDWLTRIRKKYQLTPDGEALESLSERRGDSLLQWLVALEGGGAGSEDTIGAELPEPGEVPEDTHEVEPLIGETTQEIAVAGVRKPQRGVSELSISREEQAGADQLTATIIDEQAPRPIREPEKGFSPRGIRILMGVLLVAILSLALFLPSNDNLPLGLQQPYRLAVVDWTETLPEQASLLLILNYQAGFSAEIEMIAAPILESISHEGREVSILYASPSGAYLFNRFLDESGLTDDLVIYDLGFYPVESFGAFGLANQVNTSWQLRSQPEFSKSLPSEPFDGIMILADDYESAMAWIEQFSSLAPETPIYLLVTAQAEPLLLPYWESGQVMGITAGMADAISLEGETTTLVSHWRAFQAGMILAIMMLTIGLVFPVREPNRGKGWDGR